MVRPVLRLDLAALPFTPGWAGRRSPSPSNLSIRFVNDLLQGINLYLVGMMGAGKSTTATHLARHLGYRCFDTDTLIERVAEQSVSDMFAQQGEAAFRQLEHQVLSQLAAYQRSVISTGGGIVLDTANWSYLRCGLVVWLDVAPEVLMQRLRGDRTRPLLQTENPQQQLETLLDRRRSQYAQADIHLRVAAEDTPDALSQRILAEVPKVVKAPSPPPDEVRS